MHCMKCGREIGEQQVFCDSCQEDMKKYPVKPNATVTIPQRPTSNSAKKRSRRSREVKPEDQIRRLRLTVRCLCAALIVTVIGFALMAVMLMQLIEQRDNEPGIGQNYGTMAQTEKD